MATFTICVTQMVEQTASFEVEANSAKEALSQAEAWLPGNAAALDFAEGDDAANPEIYAVMDEDGDAVWER